MARFVPDVLRELDLALQQPQCAVAEVPDATQLLDELAELGPEDFTAAVRAHPRAHCLLSLQQHSFSFTAARVLITLVSSPAMVTCLPTISRAIRAWALDAPGSPCDTALQTLLLLEAREKQCGDQTPGPLAIAVARDLVCGARLAATSFTASAGTIESACRALSHAPPALGEAAGWALLRSAFLQSMAAAASRAVEHVGVDAVASLERGALAEAVKAPDLHHVVSLLQQTREGKGPPGSSDLSHLWRFCVTPEARGLVRNELARLFGAPDGSTNASSLTVAMDHPPGAHAESGTPWCLLSDDVEAALHRVAEALWERLEGLERGSTLEPLLAPLVAAFGATGRGLEGACMLLAAAVLDSASDSPGPLREAVTPGLKAAAVALELFADNDSGAATLSWLLVTSVVAGTALAGCGHGTAGEGRADGCGSPGGGGDGTAIPARKRRRLGAVGTLPSLAAWRVLRRAALRERRVLRPGASPGPHRVGYASSGRRRERAAGIRLRYLAEVAATSLVDFCLHRGCAGAGTADLTGALAADRTSTSPTTAAMCEVVLLSCGPFAAANAMLAHVDAVREALVAASGPGAPAVGPAVACALAAALCHLPPESRANVGYRALCAVDSVVSSPSPPSVPCDDVPAHPSSGTTGGPGLVLRLAAWAAGPRSRAASTGPVAYRTLCSLDGRDGLHVFRCLFPPRPSATAPDKPGSPAGGQPEPAALAAHHVEGAAWAEARRCVLAAAVAAWTDVEAVSAGAHLRAAQLASALPRGTGAARKSPQEHGSHRQPDGPDQGPCSHPSPPAPPAAAPAAPGGLHTAGRKGPSAWTELWRACGRVLGLFEDENCPLLAATSLDGMGTSVDAEALRGLRQVALVGRLLPLTADRVRPQRALSAGAPAVEAHPEERARCAQVLLHAVMLRLCTALHADRTAALRSAVGQVDAVMRALGQRRCYEAAKAVLANFPALLPSAGALGAAIAARRTMAVDECERAPPGAPPGAGGGGGDDEPGQELGVLVGAVDWGTLPTDDGGDPLGVAFSCCSLFRLQAAWGLTVEWRPEEGDGGAREPLPRHAGVEAAGAELVNSLVQSLSGLDTGGADSARRLLQRAVACAPTVRDLSPECVRRSRALVAAAIKAFLQPACNVAEAVPPHWLAEVGRACIRWPARSGEALAQALVHHDVGNGAGAAKGLGASVVSLLLAVVAAANPEDEAGKEGGSRAPEGVRALQELRGAFLGHLELGTAGLGPCPAARTALLLLCGMVADEPRGTAIDDGDGAHHVLPDEATRSSAMAELDSATAASALQLLLLAPPAPWSDAFAVDALAPRGPRGSSSSRRLALRRVASSNVVVRMLLESCTEPVAHVAKPLGDWLLTTAPPDAVVRCDVLVDDALAAELAARARAAGELGSPAPGEARWRSTRLARLQLAGAPRALGAHVGPLHALSGRARAMARHKALEVARSSGRGGRTLCFHLAARMPALEPVEVEVLCEAARGVAGKLMGAAMAPEAASATAVASDDGREGLMALEALLDAARRELKAPATDAGHVRGAGAALAVAASLSHLAREHPGAHASVLIARALAEPLGEWVCRAYGRHGSQAAKEVATCVAALDALSCLAAVDANAVARVVRGQLFQALGPGCMPGSDAALPPAMGAAMSGLIMAVRSSATLNRGPVADFHLASSGLVDPVGAELTDDVFLATVDAVPWLSALLAFLA